jgi:tetratricopeptide (TPR) repeat protein
MTIALSVLASSPRRRIFALALLATVVAVGTGCGSSTQNAAVATTTTSAGSNASAVQVLVNEGISQTKAHRLTQAETTFKDVLLLSPKNVYALFDLGVIDQEEGNTAGALSYYSQALRADSTYVPALNNEAIILEASNLNAALILYKQIVALEPKAATAYLQMAFIYAKQGQKLQASNARAKAIALDASLSKYPLPAKCAPPNC